MEYVKDNWNKLLTLNVSSKIAVLSTRSSGIDRPLDSDRPLSDIDIASLSTVFGGNVSCVDAYFYGTDTKNRIGKIVIKYNDGTKKTNEAPTSKEIEKIVSLKNKLFKEDSILMQVRRDADSNTPKSMPFVKISGKVVDMETGEQRPMTEEELQKILEYFGNLLGEGNESHLITNDDELKKFFRNMNRDKKNRRFFDDFF
ncbi:MAG: hypothetical protein QW644_00930 [Candidatus Micrarchaeaceae archaeon]